MIIGAAGMVGAQAGAVAGQRPAAGSGEADAVRRGRARGAGGGVRRHHGRARYPGSRRGRDGGRRAARRDLSSRRRRLGRGGGGLREGLRGQFRRHAQPASRRSGRCPDYRPKLVFTSSIAVFGAPFPETIPDEFFLTPLTSYGTQKAMGELMLADYSRRGFLDGIGIRLPTICIRPGLPNKAASGFFSEHPARAARGQAGGAAGVRRRAPLAREPARGGRLPAPRADARHRSARGAPEPDAARPVGHGRASRSRRCAAPPATRRWR